MGVSFWDDPYPIYKSFQERAAIFWDDALEVWVVTGRDAAGTVLRSTAMSSDWLNIESASREFPELEQMLRGWFLLKDPPEHTRLRRTMQSWFSRGRADSLAEEIQSVVSTHLDRVRGLPTVDLARDFASPVASGILARVLDVPDEVTVKAAEHLASVAKFLAQPYRREFAEQAADAVDRLNSLYRSLAPSLSRSSALFPLLDDDSLPPDTYLHTAHLVSFAGQETTAGLIGTGLLHLLHRPELYKEVAEGQADLEAVIEELLRFDTPVPQVPRVALSDVAVDGCTIRAGDRVLVVLAAANRDWANSEDADVLDFAREQKNIAFGAGIHYCLGAPIARKGALTAIRDWTTTFPETRLSPETVRWAVGTGNRGLESAVVQLA
ncbi:cytochrome P450 [Streptomyces sp. NPDC056224]|uniref:cytochrome P450 n=1 Tax=Streptomyces sp. NPDC056224 TaxID=3345750 RepID=UPI0035DDD741